MSVRLRGAGGVDFKKPGELSYLVHPVETTATTAVCSSCGAAASPHARRPGWVRDLSAGGRAVTLVWVERFKPTLE